MNALHVGIFVAGLVVTQAQSSAATPAKTAPAKTAPAKTAPAKTAPAKAAPASTRQAPAPERAAALEDARQALLGPCAPEQASARVAKVTVVDGATLNVRNEKDGRTERVDPMARFLDVTYTDGEHTGSDHRQIGTAHALTTAEAQTLLGAKVCVFGK